MQKTKFLLYGANGYTGRLIAELAAHYGLQPVLAGRNRQAIEALAAQQHLPCRIVDLQNADDLKEALKDVAVVLHAAGPFKYTAWPMLEACLQTGTHYIDITGEIEVFEIAKKYDSAAQQAGIMILPGAGFDVVPTDCLALYLHNLMPDAMHLKLAFASTNGGVSHGTALTMLEGLAEGGAVRERGRIVKKPLGHK
ncbi:MAG: saccharopine dehydrogenase family protein, partial [Chitinophagaceae bacterium]